MSYERVEGKDNEEHGRAEGIGREFGEERELPGKEQKEIVKAEEKIGKEREKEVIAYGPTYTGYVCSACGASFASEDDRAAHNQEVHAATK